MKKTEAGKVTGWEHYEGKRSRTERNEIGADGESCCWSELRCLPANIGRLG